ncbi:hypothetical protein [Gehongia tenuis]|uniref:Arc family DNA-binding protein n=1 Tax=Gehongia tenuis TaxID=2763655 RepID=A0A926HQF5_9FIRM|nr:hypothetical protein [Gehongia tenuis]MBC8532158.1 Arc family DNA-binding protein [Gehongia tenuis]
MATNKIQTGLRLQPLALGKITAIAKQEHRSLNAQIEYAVQKCIDEYEATHGEIVLPEEQ